MSCRDKPGRGSGGVFPEGFCHSAAYPSAGNCIGFFVYRFNGKSLFGVFWTIFPNHEIMHIREFFMKKADGLFALALVAAIILLACSNHTNPEPGLPPLTVSIEAISGVTAPVTGAVPVTVITETTQYTGAVTWDPAVSGTFEPLTEYKATITLKPKAGFTLEGVEADFFTVEIASATNTAGSNMVTAFFPSTGGTLENPVPISLAAISGVTVPVTGTAPKIAIIETAQYSGDILWTPGVTLYFAAATIYTATISLSPKNGFTVQGVAADFFTVAGASVSNAADSALVIAIFPSTGGTANNPVQVGIAYISGVTAPVTGGVPVTVINENPQYSGTVQWEPAVSGIFAVSTVYKAKITLTTKTGYTLRGVAADYFKVAGATTTNAADSGEITAIFPATAALNPITVTSIQGVTAPVRGEVPVTAITENLQYDGKVTWKPAVSGIFAAGVEYTATIALTVKPGFTMNNVVANFFVVSGATATNEAGSGVVTAVFPATIPFTIIDIAVIEGVIAPVRGAAPVTAIDETEQYTGTVSWAPPVFGTFSGSTIYTAGISLTAKDGFTLQGVEADFFTVEGAKVIYAAGARVVSATFPTTAGTVSNPVTVTIKEIPGVTVPVTGVAPVTAITETAQYTGTVTWEPTVSDTFLPDTEYTATINLSHKTGFTLQGVTADFFDVSGASSVSNAVNTGEVTAEFPATAPAGEVIEVYFTGGPVDEDIDLTPDIQNDISISLNTQLTVIVEGDFDHYEWFFNGVLLSGSDDSCTIHGGDYSAYENTECTLTVVCWDGYLESSGVSYSKEVLFRIVL